MHMQMHPILKLAGKNKYIVICQHAFIHHEKSTMTEWIKNENSLFFSRPALFWAHFGHALAAGRV